MLFFSASVTVTVALALGILKFALATPTVLWEGRAPLNYTETDIDESFGPYLRYVGGSIIRPNAYMKGLQHCERNAATQSSIYI
jgi:hypothetical protein